MLAWVFALTAWHSTVGVGYKFEDNRCAEDSCFVSHLMIIICIAYAATNEETELGSSMEHAAQCLDRVNADIPFHVPDIYEQNA